MFKFLSATSLIVAVFLAQSAYAGTLSCSVTTQAICNSTASTTVLRMSGTTGVNAHAELASGVNINYDDKVVCCTGVTGLGYSCSTGATTTIVRLSGTGTNSHVEQSGQANYANNACLSVGASGSVSVGYQANNCTGYDTTLFSMSGAGLTNTHVGTSTVYTNKVCASATGTSGLTPSATLTSSLFDSAVTGGAGYNSVMWGGTIGTGKVKFQFATSDCTNGATNYPTCSTGSWSYIGGPSCGTGDWFDAPTPLVPVELKGTGCQSVYNNKRYFRYKVQLCSASDCTSNGSTSPVVSKIVVNWTP